MHNITIKVTSSTNVSQILANFKNDCMRHGIPDEECMSLFEKVEANVTDLVKRGRELASIGSQFHIIRDLESESCRVVLNVEFGVEKSTMGSKLRSFFSRRRG